MKKKIKLKKNLIILIIIIILIPISITILSKQKTNKITKNKKELTKEEKKLKQLDNINNKIDYFNMNYLDRYIEYKNNNKNLSNEQIIKNVNMHLDKSFYEDVEEAKYLNTEKVLVNKHYYLKEDYIPDNLENISSMYALSGMKMVKEAKEEFENLSKDARSENLKIVAMSSYRSYDYQVNLYNKYASEDGKEAADTYSGRPGHSEHQTGLAVDVYNIKESYTNFENTEEFKWMQEHAHEYGFILRFPKEKEKEKETGYIYESWHYRYVGLEVAKYIKENNISFEEYYATKIKDWN